MKRSSLVVLAALLAWVIAAGRGTGADPVADKLEKAKTKYEESRKKVEADAKKYFDRKEEAARKAAKDNKKLLDQATDERRAFEEHGILSDKAPMALRTQAKTSADAIEKAYKDAANAYTKAKKDAEAKVVSKEWDELKAKGLVAAAPPGELWRSLFNGKDLTGWDNVSSKPNEQWRVVDGAIQAENKDKNGRSLYLQTSRADFDDFHLRMEVWFSPVSSVGLHFRQADNAGNYGVMICSGNGETGGLWKQNKKLGAVTLNWL